MRLGHRNLNRSGNRSKPSPMAEINVTPFVDVMLVLLIIFMVTAPLLVSGVPVELPQTRANALNQTPDQVTISIDSTGSIYIDDRKIESGALFASLKEIDADKSRNNLVIVLRADRSLQYARVMSVMGELNRAGLNSISLVTNSIE